MTPPTLHDSGSTFDAWARHPRRRAALEATRLLDTASEERFDSLTRLACRVFDVPVALITLLDGQRLWFKSACGTPLREIAAKGSFCAHTLARESLVVIEDASQDPRFADSPSVSDTPFLRFYAGAPIQGPDEMILGTFCLLDERPRTLSDCERETLEGLARLTSLEITRGVETAASHAIGEGHQRYITRPPFVPELLRHSERRHVAGDTPRVVLSELLDELLDHVQGEYGLVGSLEPGDEGRGTLKILGLSSVETSPAIQEFFLQSGRRLCLERLDTVSRGRLSRRAVQFLDEADLTALNQAKLPPGHPRLDNVLIVPFLRNDRRNGLLLIANLASLPEASLIDELTPLQVLGGRLVRAHQDAQQRASLQARLEEFRATLDATLDLILIVDEQTRRLSYCNQGALAQLGYPETELLALPASTLNEAFDVDSMNNRLASLAGDVTSLRLDTTLRCRDGSGLPVQAVVQRINHHATGRTHYIIVARDLRETLKAQREIDWITHHDALTHQLNRSGFLRAVEQRAAAADDTQRLHMVVIFGIDRFRRINDAHGTQQGDAILKELAQQLNQLLHKYPQALLGRLGSDEFAVSLRVNNTRKALELADRWRQAVENHRFNAIDGLQLTVSAGVATDWQDEIPAEELLRRANAALVRAKRSGRNRFRQYLTGMLDEASRDDVIERRLAGAFKRGDFLLNFQPQWNLDDLSFPCGAEVLLRWHDADLGVVGPDVFIPILEDSGLMVEVGRWIVERSLDTVAAARERLADGFFVSINVSAVQLMDDRNFADFVAEALRVRRLPASVLELEVTETALIQSPLRVEQQLDALHQQSIAIALDDFGTGFSSLSHLKQFPFDTVKIDKSFIAGLPSSTEDRAIVESLLTLCRGFGRRVCAEGIETPAQLDFLRRLQCTRAQGYLLGRPGPELVIESPFQ
ncbi:MULTISPECIES: EAL domain-containing protein [unclassified Modicisalibacter]|uniref:sensor domain-containing phosphodiesterase n=1 Tax=unclassified Modicisalibacter TaxID=2679913 RepID=UPI001CC904D1|nr:MULTISPECIES: EAL domain-containing protein [unclassified Modicisalibacter]MBZ9556974.1 EAL domain-containing protein [Modicisalibacter sp. R2A 31.J]MBZ9574312.1 EAL domain-containing protein [Modicisalibacter sp. MOD 31.J]